jgi:conjugative relaxase-like TrwC/TraI family protein
MMSLSKVSNGAAAASYYEGADDYYSEDGRAPSEWFGAGAAALGLVGSVDSAEFAALLDGKLPDGTELHGGAEGRRAGTDLTFSAPKSVSMQALVGGDTRVLAAHDAAVTRTLAYAQDRLAAYRMTHKGETLRIDSGNLVVARFRHDLSRDCDPQLHTHSVIVNATQNVIGEWRALDISEFYRQQKLLGAHYRAELAQEVQRLGYAVRLTHGDGRFELAHISDTHIAAFSSRSQSIATALAKRGKDRHTASAKEKEIAGLATRQAKQDYDRAGLRARWMATSTEFGIDYAPALLPVLTAAERAQALQEAVSYAVEHATERQSITTHASLAGLALGRATGAAVLAEVETELAQRVETGELHQVGQRYTTNAAQGRERDMLDIEARGRDAVAPIGQPLDVLCSLTATKLNAGQCAAAEAILTTRHRIIGVQGLAGTGKTDMQTEVQEQATRNGWRVVGIAPSAAASQELTKAGIDSMTIAAFLVRPDGKLNERTLLVVDEAGMVPVADMLGILRAVEQANAHLVLVGDTQQLKAVQAGKPFAQLQHGGMQTAVMSEILRQHNATLKEAVELAAQGKIDESLKRLAPRIVEIDHAVDRHARIARDYVALVPSERANTLVVSGTNAARMAINDNVRQRLGLAGSGIEVKVLERRDLTQAQLKSSLSYQPGDVVQMLAHYDSLGLTRGTIATVMSAEAGRVTLQREDGHSVEWRPAIMNKVAAYQLATRELAVGDLVRFNENNYARDYINGDRGKVVALDHERRVLTVSKNNGQRLTLDASKPLQLDHAYCVTVHSAQGQTCDRVLIDADVKSAMANESLYYVAISRPRTEVQLYTDDKALLPEAMSRPDEKHAALELTT